MDHHKQRHGFAHGGVISYLANNAITFACGIALKSDCVTTEFKINYVRPSVGSHLIARSRVRSIEERQAVAQCDIFAVSDGEEKLCALAQGTVAKTS